MGVQVTLGLLLALALVLVAAGDATASRRSLSQVNSAISGGFPAERNRYPWMVSLRYASFTDFHYCGASLIHKRVAMTAAHCVLNDHNAWSELDYVYPEVRIGGYEYDGGKYEARKAMAVLAHEGYDSKFMNNDIALILLDRDSTKPTVKLPPGFPSPAASEGMQLRAIGWGSINDKLDKPSVLQETTMYALSIPACKSYFQPLVVTTDAEDWSLNSMMCAANAPAQTYTEGTCYGDSGGPLFLKGTLGKAGRRGRDMQVGIVSWGIPPAGGDGCHSRYPSGFTDVAHMRKWIDAGVQRLLNGTAAGAAAASQPSPAVAAANARRTDTLRALGFARPRAIVPKFAGGAVSAAVSYPCNIKLAAAGCRTCDPTGAKCTECMLGYVQVNGKCQQCMGGRACISCGANLQCQACQSGFSLSMDGGCYECEALFCFQCYSSPYVCSKCLDEDNHGGFWWQAARQKCLQCSTGCINCSNSSTCRRCAPGMALVGGRCVRCTDPRCSTCPNDPNVCSACRATGYRLNITTKRCVHWAA